GGNNASSPTFLSVRSPSFLAGVTSAVVTSATSRSESVSPVVAERSRLKLTRRFKRSNILVHILFPLVVRIEEFTSLISCSSLHKSSVSSYQLNSVSPTDLP